MRIVITGAGGFVGQAVIRKFGDAHDIIAVDTHLHGLPGIEGDLCNPDTLEQTFAGGCDAVVNLATVPGGAAELDAMAAKRTNLDATMALIDAAANAQTRPRFIFASSIAVFGDPLPSLVDDATPLAPRMLYGAHKAMMETWIDTQTRRGAISGLSMRLPGIVARPRAASGMKSAFMSELFHTLKESRPIALPVSANATMWLMSVSQLAENIGHAIGIDEEGAVTLPACRAPMAELVAAVAAATSSDPALASYAPNPELEAAFGHQPPLSTPRAAALGFLSDGDIHALAASALATLD